MEDSRCASLSGNTVSPPEFSRTGLVFWWRHGSSFAHAKVTMLVAVAGGTSGGSFPRRILSEEKTRSERLTFRKTCDDALITRRRFRGRQVRDRTSRIATYFTCRRHGVRAGCVYTDDRPLLRFAVFSYITDKSLSNQKCVNY